METSFPLIDSTTHPCSLLLLLAEVAICRRRPLKVLPTLASGRCPPSRPLSRSWAPARHRIAPPMRSSPCDSPAHQQTELSWTRTAWFPLLFAGAQAQMRTESGTGASTTSETRHKTRRPRRCSGRASWGGGLGEIRVSAQFISPRRLQCGAQLKLWALHQHRSHLLNVVISLAYPESQKTGSTGQHPK